jgi:glucokinase
MPTNGPLLLLAAGSIGFFLGYFFSQKHKREKKRCGVNKNSVYVGIDVGGTTISVAVVNYVGKKLGSASSNITGSNNYVVTQSSEDQRSFKNVVKLISALVIKAIKTANLSTSKRIQINDVAGFGIGAPGLLNTTNGIIKAIANFDWKNAHITEEVAQQLGVDPKKIYLENDANAALLAELWVGAGKGRKDVVMLTLGTGVGCAIMSGGQVLYGESGDAGEVGHTIIVPNGREHGTTGVRGIFEGYASATAVVSRAKERLQAEPHVLSPLREIGEKLSCADIFFYSRLCKQTTMKSNIKLGKDIDNSGVEENTDFGCNIANSIVMETAEFIGIGCINVCRCYDPAVVILSGGMTLAGPQLLEAIRNSFCSHHWNITPPNKNRITFATCGDDAGMIGAAGAAFLKQNNSF